MGKREMLVSNDVSAFNPSADGVDVAHVVVSFIRGDVQISRKMDPDSVMELATKLVIAADYARTGSKYCGPTVRFQIEPNAAQADKAVQP